MRGRGRGGLAGAATAAAVDAPEIEAQHILAGVAHPLAPVQAYIAGYHGRARHSVSLRPEGSSSGRPAAGADGERSECVARGEEYAAELAQMEGAGGDNDFNASFQSPITTARDGTFLWMAQATGTDKVQYHCEPRS